MTNLPIDLRDLSRDRKSIAALAAHLIADIHGGEDLAQESVYRLLRSGGPRGHENRLAWLRTTVRRLAMNEHRDSASRRQREREAARPEATLSSDQIAERVELCHRVHLAIESLTREHASVLRDHYFGDLTASEMAARDGLSVNTIKSRIRRARAVLRRALEEDGVQGELHWSIALAPLAAGAPAGVAAASLPAGAVGSVLIMKKIISFAAALALLSGLGLWLSLRATTAPPSESIPRSLSTPGVVDSSRDATLADVGSPPAGTHTAASRISVTSPTDRTATTGEGASAPLAHVIGRLLRPDGQPVSGASLVLEGWVGNQERRLKYGAPDDWADVTGTTDVDGRFDLEFDPPRAFQFTLDATVVDHAGLSWRWSSLPPGETTDLGSQTFAAAGTIVGRVVTVEGNAPGGRWIVYAESSVRSSGTGAEPSRVHASADRASGAFRLEGIPPGPTTLKAYNDAANWIKGPTVVVEVSREVSVDIVYEGPDLGKRITVTTFSRPFHHFSEPENGRIIARDAAGREWNVPKVAGTSQTHALEDAPPGEYTIEIESEVHLPWSRAGVSPGDHVKAHLIGSAAIALTVVDAESGETIEKFHLRLRFENARFSPNEFQIPAPTDDVPIGGLLEGLIPRDSTLTVDAEGYAPKEVPLGALPSGTTTPALAELERGARLDVRVLHADGSAAAGAAVLLHPHFPGYDPRDPFSGPRDISARTAFRGASRDDTAGPDGVASFNSLPTGTVDARATLGVLSATVEGVDVASGEVKAIELRLPPRGALAGVVRGKTGADFSEVRVFVFPKDKTRPAVTVGGRAANLVPIDSSGRFRVDGLATGAHVVELCVPPRIVPTSPNSATSTQSLHVRIGEVDIAAGRETTATFDATEVSPCHLEISATIDGAPAPGLVVRARRIQERDWLGGVLDANGMLRLGPLLPGSWEVTVRPLIRGWVHRVPDALTLESGSTVPFVIDVGLARGRILVLDLGTKQAATARRIRIDGRMTVKTDGDGWLEAELTLGPHTFTPLGEDGSTVAGASPITIEWGPSGPTVDSVQMAFE